MTQADLAGSEHEAGPTPDQPVTVVDRIVSLDFIRGIAVLGILFANITAFGHPMMAYLWPDILPDGGNAADDAMWLFQFIFVDGKFRGLFTLLFGAGMVLFMERVWARGGTRWLQVRRLLWLLLFGLLHFFLLFRGDILTSYAVWGLAAVWMVRWEAQTLLIGGLVGYVVSGLLMIAMLGFQVVAEQSAAVCDSSAEMGEMCTQMQDGIDETVADARLEAEVYSTGSYADVFDHTMSEQWSFIAKGVFFGMFETLPLMMLGMALYKYGFFSGGIASDRLRRWGWIGLALGIALTAPIGWWAYSQDFPFFLTNFVFSGASHPARLPMVLGLAALLTLWAPAAAKGWLGLRFVAAGRMAFSNYILTSVIMMIVFQGWGLGLYGQLHRVELFGVVVVAWVAMLAWSKPWLERFRFGPLEWLWRCLTYGKVFALRR